MFYEKSSWEPTKAGKEIEELIKKIQEKFDNWTPPRFIRDNLSKSERSFLSDLKEQDDRVYKWEDKGPSFTKMTTIQYTNAGEKELENHKFYTKVANDVSEEVKRKSDELVQKLLSSREVSEKLRNIWCTERRIYQHSITY